MVLFTPGVKIVERVMKSQDKVQKEGEKSMKKLF